MSRRRRLAVIVDDGTDPVAGEAMRSLRATPTAVRRLAAGDLARAPLELTGTGARLAGREVGAVFFRAATRTWFANGFEEADAEFCNAETASAWMALLDLEPVLAINRSDAELWFSDSEWSVWRRRLIEAGVAVTPLTVGAATSTDERRWMPWGGGLARMPGPRAARCLAAAEPVHSVARTSVWLRASVVAGDSSPGARAAAAVMADHGATFAEVRVAGDDTVFACSSRPLMPSASEAVAAGRRIAEEIDDHLRGR